MAGKSNTFENDILQLIFNGVTITGLAANVTSSPLTQLYVALHTVDPGEAGTQQTSEISYPNYARKAVDRTAGGFVVTSNSVSPVADIDFSAVGSGGASPVATHASIGTAGFGAGKILYSGAISPPITCSEGVVPRIKANSTIVED